MFTFTTLYIYIVLMAHFPAFCNRLRISLTSESRALTFSPYAPVLEELITNAIKYGKGKDILVKIQQREEMVVTTVESEGDECGTEIWGR